MSAWMLNLAYGLTLLIFAPWLFLRSWWRGRRRGDLLARFRGLAPQSEQHVAQRIWMHAVSVGEVNALRTLIHSLQQSPGIEIVLSTTTAAGFELARTQYPHLKVFYSPLDFSWAVANAFRSVRPSLMVFCELELWPNWIRAANRLGVPVAVVNARMSPRSFRGYSRIRWFMRSVLQGMQWVACQTQADRDRYVHLGLPPDRINVTGSMKFDGAEMDRDNARTVALRSLGNFADQDVILMAGSTSAPEERLVLRAFQQLSEAFPQLRCVIVPRHPERFDEVGQLIASFEFPWLRRSELPCSGSGTPGRILLVDTVGELGAWWGLADFAYVGGSMGAREGQNMIEPAAYGADVCFGPRTRNFRDVVLQLTEHQACTVVHGQHELAQFVRAGMLDTESRRLRGQRARQVVRQNLGATQATRTGLVKLLQSVPGGRLSQVPLAPYIIKLGRRSAVS